MRKFQNSALAILAAGGLLMAASPAFAVTWTCTAKNAAGASYTASAVGPRSLVVQERARAKALAACHANSVAPGTCYIVGCHT